MDADEKNDAPLWIPVGELASGSNNSNKLPPSEDLVGKDLSLHFENGQIFEYRFKSANKLFWCKVSDTKRRRWTGETYSATRVRNGIYFLDYITHLRRAATVSLVLDLSRQIFTSVIGQLPRRAEVQQDLLSRALEGKELTGVKAAFSHGSIDKPFNGATTARHSGTEELIGMRIEYAYSPTDLYEHVYLNGKFYTWHCLAGVEKGLADTDRCHYFKIADRLYLFVWREKIIPTLGVLIEDFSQMRTSGKLFGYRASDFEKLSNFTIGARAHILEGTIRKGETAREKSDSGTGYPW